LRFEVEERLGSGSRAGPCIPCGRLRWAVVPRPDPVRWMDHQPALPAGRAAACRVTVPATRRRRSHRPAARASAHTRNRLPGTAASEQSDPEQIRRK
jgi:hypothetical protein